MCQKPSGALHRWQGELFSKWMKQHLRITAFLDTSENAVKTQIRTAVSVYVLVASRNGSNSPPREPARRSKYDLVVPEVARRQPHNNSVDR